MLTGAYFSCPAGKHPYLVKAVWAKGYGKFRAEQHGNSLAIVWGTLDALQAITRGAYSASAVVVNLDFTPDAVYTELSWAM